MTLKFLLKLKRWHAIVGFEFASKEALSTGHLAVLTVFDL
jgi:hypothetical protein